MTDRPITHTASRVKIWNNRRNLLIIQNAKPELTVSFSLRSKWNWISSQLFQTSGKLSTTCLLLRTANIVSKDIYIRNSENNSDRCRI